MKAVAIVSGFMIVSVFSIMYYIGMRLRNYNLFQQNMNVGDACIVYINNERTEAIITAIFEESVIVEDCPDGDAHGFSRADIYPPRKKMRPCTSR
jgi:predicted RNA-binding protein with PUA-like domain